jgi:hypothetical protein
MSHHLMHPGREQKTYAKPFGVREDEVGETMPVTCLQGKGGLTKKQGRSKRLAMSAKSGQPRQYYQSIRVRKLESSVLGGADCLRRSRE